MHSAEHLRSDNILLRGSCNICAVNLLNQWSRLAGFALNTRRHLSTCYHTRLPDRPRRMVYLILGAMLHQAVNLAPALPAR
jgi:hypothetical protein